MAKLKGPLFSLGASQQLGKALVYFSWKGLNVVREYVIPSNPKTTKQNTQRGYLKALVAAIHTAQALTAQPLNAEDVTAYALLGSIQPTPRTWFNELVRNGLNQLVAIKYWSIWHEGHLTPGTAQLFFKINCRVHSGAVPTTTNIKWGTSKTALINTQATTVALLTAGVIIPNLTKGVKYYAKAEPRVDAKYIGSSSGIYYGVPT